MYINSFSNFFDFCDFQKIFGEDFKTISKQFSFEQWNDVAKQCKALLPEADRGSSGVFNFNANSRVSAYYGTCRAFECRLAKIDELARFAAFYADSVSIMNPVTRHVGRLNDVQSVIEFIEDVHLLRYIRPLLDWGIIKIAPTEFHFCEEHYEKHYTAVRSSIEVIRGLLDDLALTSIEYKLEFREGRLLISETGSDDFLDHPSMFRIMPNLPEVLRSLSVPVGGLLLTRDQVAEAGLHSYYSQIIESDLINSILISNKLGGNYLTDRKVDFSAISLINGSKTNNISNILTNNFGHRLPVIANIELGKIVDIRNEENEAFQVYRDAMCNSLKGLENLDNKDARDVYNEVVRPEINNIQSRVSRARKKLESKMATNVSILFGSLLTAIYDQNIAKIAVALGGCKITHDVLSSGIELLKPSQEALENKFYFYWKAQKLAE